MKRWGAKPTTKPLYSNIDSQLKCPDFLQNIKLTKYLGSGGGSSPSTVAFGKYTGTCKTICRTRDIALKIIPIVDHVGVPEHPMKVRTVAYEDMVYRTIMAKSMDMQGDLPGFDVLYNIVPYVTGITCDPQSVERWLSMSDIGKKVIADIQNITMQTYEGFNANHLTRILIIITEKDHDVKNMTKALGEVMVKANNSRNLEHIIKSYIFQTLVTMKTLEGFKIRNNDPHMDNILISSDPAENYMHYYIDGRNYKIPVKYGKVLMFDWDNAHCYKCGLSVLDNRGSPLKELQREPLFQAYGIEDTSDARHDVIVFLAFLINNIEWNFKGIRESSTTVGSMTEMTDIVLGMLIHPEQFILPSQLPELYRFFVGAAGKFIRKAQNLTKGVLPTQLRPAFGADYSSVPKIDKLLEDQYFSSFLVK